MLSWSSKLKRSQSGGVTRAFKHFSKLLINSTAGEERSPSMRIFLRALVLGYLIFPLLIKSEGAAQTVPSVYRFLERAQEAGPIAGQVTFSTGRFGY